MDRCGIFVDAGHLLAQGGQLCCGNHRRTTFMCAYPALIAALSERITGHAGLPLLRIYWYDGANDAIPTLDHLTIAGLQNVKLRLGRISFGRQKGVDALIYRDLMTLSRERAMATAYLVAGDEDVREGVVAAQDLGVRVVLVGIQPVAGYNQSPYLVREADDQIVLDAAFLGPFFAAVPAPAAPAALAAAMPAVIAFAQQWRAQATDDEVRRLLGLFPRIPRDLDAQLLGVAEQIVGVAQVRAHRPELRAAFWQALREVAAPGAPAEPAGPA
jgi:NYN domain-containing protein